MNQVSRDFSDALVSMQARHSQPGRGNSLVLANGMPVPEDRTAVTPKYVDWFQGERTIQELRAPAVKKTLSERELAEKDPLESCVVPVRPCTTRWQSVFRMVTAWKRPFSLSFCVAFPISAPAVSVVCPLAGSVHRAGSFRWLSST